MILGLSPFTAFHTLLSLIAIAAGVPVVVGFFTGRASSFWTGLFLGTAIATSVTGFLFPIHGVTPAIMVGIVALVVFAGVLSGRYVFRLSGPWRPVYVLGIVANLYFLVFVAIVQAFAKIGFLKALAPTQTELPFTATQAIVLIAFIVIAVASARAFHPGTPSAA
jgi:hypothetical protein